VLAGQVEIEQENVGPFDLRVALGFEIGLSGRIAPEAGHIVRQLDDLQERFPVRFVIFDYG